jgi:HSP20 family protein
MFPTNGPFDLLRREVNDLFEGFGRGYDALGLAGSASPALNIWEDGDALYAEAEVPGIQMKDLEVQVVGRELTIKGQRESSKTEGTSYHRQERTFGSFVRSVTLPVEVNADKVEAVLKDGVLRVTLPKADVSRARKISVRTE